MRTLLAFTVLAVLLAASSLTGRVAVTTGQEDSLRLSGLEIDVWPEFDRPSVLVILRAELAEDTVLPADVALRIPTSAGQPAALAYAPSDTAGLVNLGYEITDVQIDFTTVEFTTPDRFFHMELYEDVQTDVPERSYSYVWLGDLAVDQLVAQLQEPAGATGISVEPDLDRTVVGPDGLVYREGDLGGLEAGETLSINVQYTKTDSRTSAEILDFQSVDQEPEPSDAGSRSGSGVSTRLLIIVAVAAIVVGAAALTFLLRRSLLPAGVSPPRKTRAERRRKRGGSNAQSCSECGNRLRSGDRFCPECGSAAGDR